MGSYLSSATTGPRQPRRLATSAIGLVAVIGLVTACTASSVGAAKRNAIAALIAFVDVPIVHFSVEWWRTLHQKATVFNPELNPKIHGVMGLTLWIGTIAFTLVYVYLLDRRYRLAVLEEGAADVEVRDLGWRFWYGGPHARTSMVACRRP